LGKREYHRPVPINNSEDENKKDKEEKEPIERLPFPQIIEPNEKVREEFAQPMILLLKLADLKGFLLFDHGMNLFFLNKDAMTIETDGLLIGSSRIESKGWTSTHGTAV
jgi:hypothetical protein